MGQMKSKTQDQKKGSKLPDIPLESPLGIMIRNWNNRGPRKGKSKLKMVQYCMVEWPKEPLKPHVFWPVFGSFEDWVCQALNIYVNTKEPFSQEESDYAGLWIRTSRPFPASILALKADEKPEEEEKEKEKGKNNDEWEPLDNIPPPYNPPPAAPHPGMVPPPPPAPTAPRSDLPPAARTRSRTAAPEGTVLYPLREVPLGGNQGGIGFVAVPLSTTDMRNFKKEMGTLLDDPLGVAEKLDQFLGPNTYTWEEMQSILGILFTTEEKGMIRQAGMRIWERQNQAGPPADQKWPNVDPHWDHQQPQGRKQQLRWTVLPQGFTESPNLFGQTLETILQDFTIPREVKSLQYRDDLLIAGETEEETQKATIKLLNFLGEKGLKVSRSKLQFTEQEVRYLGHWLSKGKKEIRP